MLELTTLQRCWRALPIVRDSRPARWEGWAAEAWFAVGELLIVVAQAVADVSNRLLDLQVRTHAKRMDAGRFARTSG